MPRGVDAGKALARMSETKPSSLGKAVKLHGPDLLRLLTRRIGWRDAADLLQEAYLRTLRHSEGQAIADPLAFLRATAINLAKDHGRRARTERKHVSPEEIPADIVAPEANPEDRLLADERLRKVLDAVAALPPRCREVVMLRRFEDLSQDEIARRLGISRNMVEKHLRLALERCRAALE